MKLLVLFWIEVLLVLTGCIGMLNLVDGKDRSLPCEAMTDLMKISFLKIDS